MTNHNGDIAPAVPAPTGLRAQLHHLLPRHALFHVRITIHQLASVPLVSGEFGVRWKFKNTHKVKGKDKAKQPDHDGDGDSFGSADTSTEEAQTSGAQSHRRTGSSSSISAPGDAQASTSARGQTPWVPLRDHSVSWEQPLSAVVQMSIDRDTHRLLPHPFKLTVLQRVIAHDPDAPNNPRFGLVELDLAEYADSVPLVAGSKGVVTRRYLLRESKTNATMRLSIRVEPVGTPPPFTAPSLPNGEILAGVATLLSAHADVYRTRPRALDLYAPVENRLQPTRPNNSNVARPFDVRALPRAYGPRPTETLIDALFNPSPVREEHLLGPFTRLVTDESGSVPSFPSFPSTPSSTPYSSPSFSSRPDTASSTALSISTESASLYSVRQSIEPSSNGHGSLAPSGHSSANGHGSVDPSVASRPSMDVSADSQSHRWWKRNRDRAATVAVA
ncbi:N-terminal C2 in EEIG1 and EHBP1 proteins-domain-containing protein [Mycena rosella]|uniref:N-terminal C2 in EEIG1 and EHBP1 proteins-domain-containing protein n=1 Tax=Mycena rosella TaxID=1033263 RepID=A0AAD7D1B1_MYCRO|nr:N-terminal C2 in EEIG1 and EHBP1 proteins-domain-containing protein [Mycena rosella]